MGKNKIDFNEVNSAKAVSEQLDALDAQYDLDGAQGVLLREAVNPGLEGLPDFYKNVGMIGPDPPVGSETEKASVA